MTARHRAVSPRPRIAHRFSLGHMALASKPARALVATGLAAAVALAPAVRSGTARADGLADEADLHFSLATERYRNADYRGALEHFLFSNRLVPNRNVVFNIARTFEQLQRFADAYRYYLEALDGETNDATRRALESAIARIGPNVAVIRVETDPPGATVYVDRRDLGSRGTSPRSLAYPAGRYRILVEREGYEPAQSEPIEARLGTVTPVQIPMRRIVGTLEVEGEAGAEVRLDDERSEALCTAPCRVDVPPGLHTVYFTRSGYQVLPRQVTVVARETIRTRATLTPLTGSVVVSADEREALVEIDGRSVGFTPAVIPNVAVGRRHVRVSLRGYTAVERDIEVNANTQSELVDLQLQPVREVTAASRVAENVDDAPSSVTLLDARELRAFAYPSIAEALRGVRGVTLTNDGVYTSIGIRGLGQPGDFGKRLLVLSDGMVLNDNLLSSSYVGYDGRTDIEDTERLEVVRGPGSLLYGTGAISGVVNLVQRDRDTRPGVQVGLSTYDNGVARARARVQYHFNRDAGFWISAAGARSDGRDQFITLRPDPANPTAAPQEVRVRQYESFYSSSVQARAWWRFLNVQALFHTREQALPQGAYGYALNDLRTTYQDNRYLLEVRLEPRLTQNVQLFARAYANGYTFRGRQSIDSNPMTSPQYEPYTGVWAGAEARVAFTLPASLRLTVGLQGEYHPIASIEGFDREDAGTRTPYLDPPADSRSYGVGSVYAVLDGSPVRWFRFSAGVRGDLFSFLSVPAVNPRIAAIFHLWTNGTIKLMGGSSFRAPSIYERFYTDGNFAQPAANPGMRPETAYSGELELSQRFAENWVATVAGHVNVITNFIDTIDERLPADPVNMYPERDAVRYGNRNFNTLTVGGDVEVRREWRQGWMVGAMVGYLRANYLGDETTLSSSLSRNPRVANAPEWFSSVRGVVPIIPGTLSGAVRATLEAPRRIDLLTDDVTDPGVVADLVFSGQVSRFGVRYAVGLYNMFDWRYSQPLLVSFASRTMPQQGRSVMANISAEF